MLLAPGGGQEKVTICHNGTNTITIGAPAVDAHVNNHGDTLGPCAEGGIGPVEPPLDPPTTTTTLPPTTTTTLPPTTTTTEPPDDHGSHEEPPSHSHEDMVLRCTVIDE